jgi:ABC-2 type transport system ATP-binding protein
MPAIDAANLSKRFGAIDALKNLSLSVETGSFFGLLGPNGAGKSTFMNIVSGFLRHDSGTLHIDGAPLAPESVEQKKLIGLAPQHIALYNELSAESNLSLFGKLYGLSGKKLSKRIDYALELAQLTDRRKSIVKEFSGGMKRRLNIASALLHQPKILLCDEPTVGVDPQSRNAIFDTLTELNASGMTIVYSTHYMEEAERLCDMIAIIDKGEILRLGDLDTLLEELPPINTITARAAPLSASQRAELRAFGSIREESATLMLEPCEGFLLSRFYGWVEESRLDTRDFHIGRPSLENLFLLLTGRELRE